MPDSDHDLLVRIDARQESLNQRLFGENGGLGLCQMSKKDREELFTRVNKLEAEQNKQRGILVVVGGIAGGLISGAVELVSALLKR